jgi:hypothetical protein
MRLTTREDVIKAGYDAINARGDKDFFTMLENRVEEYGNQRKRVDEVSFWFRDVKKNFETMTIEKFNDSLSNLP